MLPFGLRTSRIHCIEFRNVFQFCESFHLEISYKNQSGQNENLDDDIEHTFRSLSSFKNCISPSFKICDEEDSHFATQFNEINSFEVTMRLKDDFSNKLFEFPVNFDSLEFLARDLTKI